MTVLELKAKCKELGLKGYSKLNKAELITLINSVTVIVIDPNPEVEVCQESKKECPYEKAHMEAMNEVSFEELCQSEYNKASDLVGYLVRTKNKLCLEGYVIKSDCSNVYIETDSEDVYKFHYSEVEVDRRWYKIDFRDFFDSEITALCEYLDMELGYNSPEVQTICENFITFTTETGGEYGEPMEVKVKYQNGMIEIHDRYLEDKGYCKVYDKLLPFKIQEKIKSTEFFGGGQDNESIDK